MRHYQSSLRREEKNEQWGDVSSSSSALRVENSRIGMTSPQDLCFDSIFKGNCCKIAVSDIANAKYRQRLLLFVFSRLKSYLRQPSLRHDQHLQLINDDGSQLLSMSVVFPIFSPHQRVASKNSHSVLSPSVWARFDDALSEEGSRHEPNCRKMKSDGKQTHKSVMTIRRDVSLCT